MEDHFNQLKFWISEILVISNTRFNVTFNNKNHEIEINKYIEHNGEYTMICCFKINILYEDESNERIYFRIRNYEGDVECTTNYQDLYNLKLHVIKLTIENGIPFIIDPMSPETRRKIYNNRH